jgi:DNA polymerase-3 subunit gamma/tau
VTALYTIYRSQRFEDLVGQEAAARTLKNALVSDRVAHAYLFTGIRGTGKTSTARILAKAVNCLNLTDGEPCNECTACLAVVDGSATDLIEIDAASNRGVDEIRDLREKARYLPAQLRRKVYIIDEAHQLTPEAFNALLKTLEEPPEHVLFVLCTTEAHKLPATIVSRTQRFDFRRISEADITGRLRFIATAEGLTAGDDGLELIASMAHGSMRDAITMLDQMASAGDAGIDAASVRQQLGLVSGSELAAILAGAARGDAAFVLGEVERLAQNGADLRQLANGLAEVARKAVLISLGAADAAELGMDAQSAADVTAAVAAAGREFAAAAFEAALAASTEMKQTHDPRLLLELLLLRLASRRGLGGGGAGATAEDSAGGAAPSAATPPRPATPNRASAAVPAPPEPEEPMVEAGPVVEAVPPVTAPIEKAPPLPVDPGLAAITARWPALLEALKGTAPGVRVRALLREAAPVDIADDVLTIGFPYAIFSEKAQEPLNRAELEKALHQVYATTYRLSFRTVAAAELSALGGAPAGRVEDESPAAPSMTPAGAVPTGEGAVRNAVEILGARITDVRPRQRGPAGT